MEVLFDWIFERDNGEQVWVLAPTVHLEFKVDVGDLIFSRLCVKNDA